MKFAIESKKDITIFRLQEKRLDAALAPELKSQFVLMIEAEKKQYLIIDLAQVESIDSSGIGALLVAHRQTAIHDGFAAFIGVKGNVKDLLKMTQLDKQLYIFSSVQDVMRNLEAVEVEEVDEDEDDEEEEADELLAGIEEIGDGDIVGDDLPSDDAEMPEFPDDGGGDADEDGPKKKGKKGKSPKEKKAKKAAKEKPAKEKPAKEKSTKKSSSKKKKSDDDDDE
jgi:anti-anti-sigma factor